MPILHQSQRNPLTLRLLIVPGLLALVFAVFAFRLWQLQVVEAEKYQERAERSMVREVRSLAPRGQILDRDGDVLAGIRSSYVLTVNRSELPDDEAYLEKVFDELGLEEGKRAKIRRSIEEGPRHLPRAVLPQVPVEFASKLADSPGRYPGLGIQRQPMRYYSDTFAYSHVLGWVWTATEETEKPIREQGLQPAQFMGRAGLERVYEHLLMGKDGSESLLVDAREQPIQPLGSNNPVAGKTLILSLDHDLQTLATESLSGYRGAVVALDPKTGEVLCLVSAPTFDSRLYEQGISQANYEMLMEDPDKPSINRAIAGTYAPGSTFKAVTAIAAELAGRFDPNETMYNPGYFALGNSRINDLAPAGDYNFGYAFERSSNTFFARWADQLGLEGMGRAFTALGLGEPTGIDLNGEVGGIAPTPEWLEETGEPWYRGMTAQLGIGQANLALTPLQMAQVTAVIANRGVAYRPHLLHQIKDPVTGETETVEPERTVTVEASPRFWSELHTAMNRVVEGERGTARGRAPIPGVRWAAKTGSAQNSRGETTDSWFIGFAPLHDPQIAVAVVVENAGHGGSYASPIAQRVVSRYLLGEEAEQHYSVIGYPDDPTRLPFN
jgi:penicillin-binding protein 2